MTLGCVKKEECARLEDGNDNERKGKVRDGNKPESLKRYAFFASVKNRIHCGELGFL